MGAWSRMSACCWVSNTWATHLHLSYSGQFIALLEREAGERMVCSSQVFGGEPRCSITQETNKMLECVSGSVPPGAGVQLPAVIPHIEPDTYSEALASCIRVECPAAAYIDFLV